ncbi:MAG: HlyD family efflux transporter periplasmic adaptor subunit [Oscillospiraceae bacterium]|nr:HlyD family efflux transporter periplasmic adaptor subunit [Oscillospiraceae bacterium]
MKYQIALLSLILSFSGCGQRDASNENIQEEKPRTAVTLTYAISGGIEKEIILSATTMYQNKSVVSTPIPAFITEVLVQPGSRVKAGQTLYRIESKESHALGNGSHAVIPIKAERNGIILDVQQQTGSYVPEGSVLCSVAETESLVFEINVPYEQQRYAHSGSKCTLELPDGTRLEATVHTPLATMNTASQSERVIARAKAPFLPEGMNVKAIFTGSRTSEKSMILPKSAVQSDETLTEHWVMKLADDSTAVRVSVKTGNSNASKVEIESAALSPQDRIILTGSYGLEDGAKVVIAKEEAAL